MTEHEARTEPEAPLPPPPPWPVRALLYLASAAVALAILACVAWLASGRLDGAPGSRGAGGEGPQAGGGSFRGRIELPENARPALADLPEQFRSPGEGADALYIIPGSRDEVRDFFVAQAERHGWRVTERPSTSDEAATTLIFQRPGGFAMIGIRRHPTEPYCTVSINAPAAD